MGNENELQISVVIPVYNGEKYVHDCIDMLQKQTLHDGFEIIFINDGSTDKTLEIIQKYAKTDLRIRVISQENQGVSAARNCGVEEAKGKWIVFVDVDDEISTNYIQDIYYESKNNDEMQFLIYARHYVEKKENLLNAEAITKSGLICSLLTEEPLKELGTDFLLRTVWSKAYRTSFLKENAFSFINGLKWGEDLVFQCAVFQKAEKIKFIYRGHYRYVQNSESTMHRLRKDDTQTVKVLQQALKNVLNGEAEENVQRAYYQYMLKAWLTGISSELRAWKSEESFFSAYRRLQRIRKEVLFHEIIEKTAIDKLTRKERLKLTLLTKVPIIYLMVINLN